MSKFAAMNQHSVQFHPVDTLRSAHALRQDAVRAPKSDKRSRIGAQKAPNHSHGPSAGYQDPTPGNPPVVVAPLEGGRVWSTQQMLDIYRDLAHSLPPSPFPASELYAARKPQVPHHLLDLPRRPDTPPISDDLWEMPEQLEEDTGTILGQSDQLSAGARGVQAPARTAFERGIYGEVYPCNAGPQLTKAAFAAPETFAAPAPSRADAWGVAPPGLARVVPSESLQWVYNDPSGQLQGPFLGATMHGWQLSGWLADDLLLRRVQDTEFVTLGHLKHQLCTQHPFTAAVSQESWDAAMSTHARSGVQGAPAVPNPSPFGLAWGSQSLASVSLRSSREHSVSPSDDARYSEDAEVDESTFSGILQELDIDDAEPAIPAAAGPSAAVPIFGETVYGKPVETTTAASRATPSPGVITTAASAPAVEACTTAVRDAPAAVAPVGTSNLSQSKHASPLSNGRHALTSPPLRNSHADTAKPAPEAAGVIGSPKTVSSTVGVIGSPKVLAKPVPSQTDLQSNGTDTVPTPETKLEEPATASAAEEVAPWVTARAKPAVSLREIQTREAEKRKQQMAADAEKAKQQRARTIAAVAATSTAEPPVGIPATSTWATKPVSVPRRSIAEIQRQQAEAAKTSHKPTPTPTAATWSAGYGNVVKSAGVNGHATYPGRVPAPAPASLQERPWQTTYKKKSAPAAANNAAARLASPSPASLKPASVTDELIMWCRGSFRQGLSKDVNHDELLEVFFSLPSTADSKELIADSIYDYSTTLDGRRFAHEFLQRRKEAEKALRPGETWKSVMQRSNPKLELDPSFQVVTKKRSRQVARPAV